MCISITITTSRVWVFHLLLSSQVEYEFFIYSCQKTQSLWLRGFSFDTFKSYLENRKQHVSINRTKFWYAVLFVPQGFISRVQVLYEGFSNLPRIELGNHKIKEANRTKFLSVCFDKNLKLDYYIKYIPKIISKSVDVLQRLKFFGQFLLWN